jgi:DnaK suppressor protein
MKAKAKTKAKTKVMPRVRAKVKAAVKVKAPIKAKSRAPKAAVPTAPKSTTKWGDSNRRTDVLRQILMERRNEVMKEIEGLIGNRMDDEMQRRIDSAPDVGDQALLDSERGRDISILEMRNRVRQQIDEAIARLEEGSYGLCSDCGIEISEKRLKAVPFARRCVACQEKEELLEKIEQEEEQTA